MSQAPAPSWACAGERRRHARWARGHSGPWCCIGWLACCLRFKGWRGKARASPRGQSEEEGGRGSPPRLTPCRALSIKPAVSCSLSKHERLAMRRARRRERVVALTSCRALSSPTSVAACRSISDWRRGERGVGAEVRVRKGELKMHRVVTTKIKMADESVAQNSCPSLLASRRTTRAGCCPRFCCRSFCTRTESRPLSVGKAPLRGLPWLTKPLFAARCCHLATGDGQWRL
ncbi:hypothetical protein QBC39DRAFT_166622 [Podospora conica]|nr:hypothetical protein QBC39DRAFT_166622 [Schizothecium conicum]